jgi:hypothetical protein
MLQEIKEIVNYIQVIKDTNTIVTREISGNIYGILNDVLLGNNIDKFFSPEGIVVDTSNNISLTETRKQAKQAQSVFTIYENINMNNIIISDYNLPDEQRYVYGIPYFYNNILPPS